MQSNINVLRFPPNVVEFARRYLLEILFSGERITKWAYGLEVVRVETFEGGNIGSHQSAKSLALD